MATGTRAPSTIVTINLTGQTDFNIPFEYLARKFVVVTLLGTDRKVLTLNADYRFVSKTVISLANPTPAGYSQLELRRKTSAAERLVDFHDGSILRAYDLNLSQLQTLHVAEEARDSVNSDSISIDDAFNLDARNRKIVNLAYAENGGDAVPLSQLISMDNNAYVSALEAKAQADRAEGYAEDVRRLSSKIYDSVALMKADAHTVGTLCSTRGFYAPNDGGAASYIVTTTGNPDGFGDHSTSDGKILQLMSAPTDVNHGVRTATAFDPDIAWDNRNALQAMLRNPRFSVFKFKSQGNVWVLGSIHPQRGDMIIYHERGCNIKGRYNDPSKPASFTSQGGHMFGLTKFRDPDSGDFTWVEYIENVVYVLDGDICSEYSAAHAQRNNNNCIGLYKTRNSGVIGTGGVSGSDHRGINIDGGAVNCYFDIAYVYDTMNEPVVMKGSLTEPSTNFVRVGRIRSNFGGNNAPICVRVQDCGHVDVLIGTYIWGGSVKPQLVGAFGCDSVEVKAGYVDGVSQVLRQYETKHSNVTVRVLRNTPSIVNRAGIATGTMKSVNITGCTDVDNSLLSAYYAESNQDVFDLLRITANNFKSASSSFEYYKNKLTVGIAGTIDIHSNLSPVGITPREFNAKLAGSTDNLITGTVTNFSVNYKSPDWNYSKLNVVVDAGGKRFAVQIDLRTRELSSIDFYYEVSGGCHLVTTRSGSTLTVSVVGGNTSLVTLSN